MLSRLVLLAPLVAAGCGRSGFEHVSELDGTTGGVFARGGTNGQTSGAGADRAGGGGGETGGTAGTGALASGNETGGASPAGGGSFGGAGAGGEPSPEAGAGVIAPDSGGIAGGTAVVTTGGGTTDGGRAGGGPTRGGSAGGAPAGGVSAGGAPAGGTPTAGAPPGGAPTGGALVGITVTTGDDESDVGATPTDPGGSGLSLREAIDYANATTGHDDIVIPAGTVVMLTSTLPNLTDPDGQTIHGQDAVLDGSSMGISACISLAFGSTNNVVSGLEIRNCPSWAITINNGTGNCIEGCFIHDNGSGVRFADDGNTFGPGNKVASHADVGIQVNDPIVVIGNLFRDQGGAGIDVGNTADDSEVLENVLWNNVTGTATGSSADRIRIWHNTVHASTETGVVGADTDFRNNIVTSSIGAGIEGSAGNFAALTTNDFFGNGSGACSGCGTLDPSNRSVDPAYQDPLAGDLGLWQAVPTSTSASCSASTSTAPIRGCSAAPLLTSAPGSHPERRYRTKRRR